jgi:cation diffusion facilitator CzcD-associated flavoprotein CzcO
MTTFTNVLIIGAGFSGICAAIELQKHGVQDFKIVEKSCSLGGTWRDNRYPGSGCDVPAILYQFSFELNPDWSKKWVG